MSDNKINNLIVAIQGYGWMVANIGQADDTQWCIEARRGHITSYDVVVITEKHPGILDALRDCLKQVENWQRIFDLARNLGVRGKVTF